MRLGLGLGLGVQGDRTERAWRVACTTLPVPALPLRRIMAAPSAMRRRASPRFCAPHTKGILKSRLSMWCASSAAVSTCSGGEGEGEAEGEAVAEAEAEAEA